MQHTANVLGSLNMALEVACTKYARKHNIDLDEMQLIAASACIQEAVQLILYVTTDLDDDPDEFVRVANQMIDKIHLIFSEELEDDST